MTGRYSNSLFVCFSPRSIQLSSAICRTASERIVTPISQSAVSLRPSTRQKKTHQQSEQTNRQINIQRRWKRFNFPDQYKINTVIIQFNISVSFKQRCLPLIHVTAMCTFSVVITLVVLFIYLFIYQHNWKTKQRNGDAGKKAAFCLKSSLCFVTAIVVLFFFSSFLFTR